jgi:hypothetical protein
LAHYRDLAAKELAKPAYSHRLFHRILKPRPGDVMVQRLSDGEFVSLFFDMRRGVFFLPGDSLGSAGIEGKSLAEIGVRPTFLVRKKERTMRMVSLEAAAGATGGGSAVAASE